jgi:hypothetical protein
MAAVLVGGMECGSTANKFTVTGGATISTSTVRTGQRSMRVLPAGATAYWQHTLNAASGTSVIVFHGTWNALPGSAGDWLICHSQQTGTQPRITVTSAGVIKFGYSTGMTTHPNTVTTGVKYRFEMRVVNNDGSGTKKVDMQFGIDFGVATAGTQNTLVEAGADLTGWRLGAPTVTDATMDFFIDDVAIGNASGDYPFGPGQVDACYVVSDGTHSFVAGDFGDNVGTVLSSSTTLNQRFSKTLMPAAGSSLPTNFLEQQVVNTSGYLEFLMDYSRITGIPVAIEAMVAAQSETAAAAHAEVRLNDNGTVESATTFGASQALTTITHASKCVATRPSGGGPWTVDSLQTLRPRWGYSNDVTPNKRVVEIILEIYHNPVQSFPRVNRYPALLAQ